MSWAHFWNFTTSKCLHLEKRKYVSSNTNFTGALSPKLVRISFIEGNENDIFLVVSVHDDDFRPSHIVYWAKTRTLSKFVDCSGDDNFSHIWSGSNCNPCPTLPSVAICLVWSCKRWNDSPTWKQFLQCLVLFRFINVKSIHSYHRLHHHFRSDRSEQWKHTFQNVAEHKCIKFRWLTKPENIIWRELGRWTWITARWIIAWRLSRGRRTWKADIRGVVREVSVMLHKNWSRCRGFGKGRRIESHWCSRLG